MSRARARLRCSRVASQAGKSRRKQACSSGGVRVLSTRASASGLADRVEPSGSLPTQKPFRFCATDDSTSFALSWLQTRRPDLTALAAKVARAETKLLGSLPLWVRRRNHFQLRAVISARQ